MKKTWINRRTNQVAQQEHRPSAEWDYVEPITRAESVALWLFLATLVVLLIFLTKI